MLTVQDFFEKFRNDQVRLLSDCCEFNVQQFFAIYGDFIRILSDLTVVGIPNNVNINDPEVFEEDPFYSRECANYLEKKVDQMDDHSVIYFVDDLFKFDLDGEAYPTNDNKRSDKLSQVGVLEPYCDGGKSSFWTNSWLQSEFVDISSIHKLYLDFKKCGDISESLTDRFSNDFSVTMVIPIDHLDNNNEELFQLLSKKNTKLRITYCRFDHESKVKTNIISDFSCKRLYYNDPYRPYKLLENVKYYGMIDNIVTDYNFSDNYHIGKYYIVVECDFESLVEGYLTTFCNYLKLVAENYQGFIYMSNFRIKTMYNDVETRRKVLQMYDSIVKIK